jgi:V8-like Glu-specific endopeptidase
MTKKQLDTIKADLMELDPALLLQELHAREAERPSAAEKVVLLPGESKGVHFPAVPLAWGKRVPAEVPTEVIADVVRSEQKVIYGTDDRRDVFQVTDAALLRDADSAVALVNVGSITDNGDGFSTMSGQTLGVRRNLCSTEPFRDQPSIPFCSGFLVDPSIVATAAHCVTDASSLANVRFVFGYEMRNATTANTRIPNGDIYKGRRILGRAIGTEGTDWCVIQLERPVLNHRHVSVRRTGKIPNSAGLHVIGHPSGLPKKVAGNAAVRNNSPSRYFVANLDTYGGNSGSPVFHSSTHVLEGILVRGDTDYVQVGDCFRSNVCPVDGCDGESVTRATEFVELVPENRHDFIPFDPQRAKVIQVGGRWKIDIDGMSLLDFAASQSEANQALAIIRHYGLNMQCFVGRPDPSMAFYLTNGQAPVGPFTGEDAIGFDPANIEVRQVTGRWKVVEGDHWLLDFGSAQNEARQALSYILRYQFRFMCFVGRPAPSMTYFRR